MSAMRSTLLAIELDLLRELAHGTIRGRISGSPCRKLVRCGFARTRGGVLAITSMGHAKLAFEITRASWFPVPA